jgi:MAP/microtubule affinity-regulating kinase
VAHRDIKLENVLLDARGNVKLIDFGFSTCIPNDKKVKLFCGTPSYMAPEIVSKTEFCGPPTDIWATGVLLYTFFNGCFPFRGQNDKELYKKICSGDFVIPDYVPRGAGDILKKMIRVKAEDRLTSAELYCEPWIQGIVAGADPAMSSSQTSFPKQ